MSTITVSLSPVTQIADVDAPGFLSGLQSGWSAFLSLIMVAVTAVGFFLPFLLVLALDRDPGDHRHRPPGPSAPSADRAGSASRSGEPAEPRQEAGSGTPT